MRVTDTVKKERNTVLPYTSERSKNPPAPGGASRFLIPVARNVREDFQLVVKTPLVGLDTSSSSSSLPGDRNGSRLCSDNVLKAQQECLRAGGAFEGGRGQA